MDFFIFDSSIIQFEIRPLLVAVLCLEYFTRVEQYHLDLDIL